MKYIVLYNGKPYKTSDDVRVFNDYQKAKNYRNNAVRNIGRLICKDKDWYDIGEKNKQKWFAKAEKLLEVTSVLSIEEVEKIHGIDLSKLKKNNS